MSDDKTIALVERAPTPDEYRRLRASVGWNDVDADGVVAGLSSSLYAVVLERDGDAVGCGRVVGDGGIYFYLQDVIVLPSSRGRGWGTRIMEAVMRYVEAAARPGSFIGLMFAKDAGGSTFATGSSDARTTARGCSGSGSGSTPEGSR